MFIEVTEVSTAKSMYINTDYIIRMTPNTDGGLKLILSSGGAPLTTINVKDSWSDLRLKMGIGL